MPDTLSRKLPFSIFYFFVRYARKAECNPTYWNCLVFLAYMDLETVLTLALEVRYEDIVSFTLDWVRNKHSSHSSVGGSASPLCFQYWLASLLGKIQ